MSAFVVTEDHVKQLALAWGQWDRWTRRDHDEIVETARELMRENIRSVKARYPDSDELPGPIETPEADAIDFSIMEKCRLTPVMALKMADCLEYQSCETGWDNWTKTKAHAILQTVRKLAISKLPGYDDAPWDYKPLARVKRSIDDARYNLGRARENNCDDLAEVVDDALDALAEIHAILERALP